MSNWKERMRVDPSNAEIQVTSELQRQQMYLWERDWVLLIGPVLVTPKRKEDVHVKDLEGCTFTLPDWFCSAQMKSVYLDGPHHKKGRTAERDDRIDRLLKEYNCPVLRIPYNGRRLSHVKLCEVVDEIKEFLKQ